MPSATANSKIAALILHFSFLLRLCAMASIQSVLFDPPSVSESTAGGSDSSLNDFNSPVNNEEFPQPPEAFDIGYKVVSHLFMGLMLCQYILIFFAVPFSDVENRPVVSVFLSLFGYFVV